MIFDIAIDYDDDDGIEWVNVAQLSMGRGTVIHWKGYVDGECRYSRVIWHDHSPTDPPPMAMAA